MHVAIPPLPNRTSAEQSVMIRLTIEADSISLVRQAVIAACGDSVQFMPPQRVPRSTQVWVWLALAESAVPDAMGATLRTVPYGEIGRVVRQAPNSPKT
jgi:NADPH-dependent ferric siderophore reductase